MPDLVAIRVQDLPLTEENIHLVQLAQDELKNVTIQSTAASVVQGHTDPFTLYTIVVTCPATKTWWIIKKRYSQFYTLRQYLLKVSKASKSTTLKSILQPLVEMPFPKRGFSLDYDAMIAQRKAAFDKLTPILLAIRSMCLFPKIQENKDVSEQLIRVCEILETFLSVPDMQKKEEVRHTTQILSSPDLSTRTFHRMPSCDDDEVNCPICLCEFETDEKILHLGCGHNYHEECVMRWLHYKMSCPICRQTSICGIAD